MRFPSAFLATALALSSVADAAEAGAADPSAPLSPIRQHLRDSIKVPPLAKPAEPAPQPDPKSPDAPVLLPAFRVIERTPVQIFGEVSTALAQKERLQSRALYKTGRLEILQLPTLEAGPAGMPRLKLNFLQLKF